MLNKIMMLVFLGFASLTFTSCGPTDPYVYQPQWYYNCYPVYDYWGWYLYDECYWEYYNDNGEIVADSNIDIASSLAEKEELVLSKTTEHFQEKFALSQDKALQIAKNIQDFTALQDRSAEDVASFAQKLYGVNPSEVISAVTKAQIGLNSEFDALIEKAASNFNTDKANMKAIIKELHGRALSEGGIQL